MDASYVLSDDLSDYDVISDPGHRSVESSIADLGHVQGRTASEVYEPLPSQAARDKFGTVNLSAGDVQAYVRNALDIPQRPHISGSKRSSSSPENPDKTVRVYVDGIFDVFNTGHALQLRQAKLSFPSVYLVVGVFSDNFCRLYGSAVSLPHVERCEVVRHCRWVDEVVPDAPWQLDDQFLHRRRIDYVALDEGTSVDPACDKVRLKGYDDLKKLGKIIPTRRTTGLMAPTLAATTPPTPTPPLLERSAPDFTSHTDAHGIGY